MLQEQKMCYLGRVDVVSEIWLNCAFSSLHLLEAETVFCKQNLHFTWNLAKLSIFHSLYIFQKGKLCFLRKIYISRESCLNCTIFQCFHVFRSIKMCYSKQNLHVLCEIWLNWAFSSLYVVLEVETVFF